ncbi:MAG: polysaccharide ABC transporter ATP-binding protein [Candidatus Jettenia sp.]|nr:polysaccharide ABC transporter ATP-binding protein [Candidatus Jettenia sp.]
MDKKPAIKIENLSKAFEISTGRSSLKAYFLNMFSLLKFPTHEKYKVLEGVSFQIEKGEFIGIIGKNGSGKSTLLKLIAGIYAPDKGRIEVNGKIVPFLELGVGFNPELTGKENVFLNGVILGMSRKYIAERYEKIVGFAGLERFMDTPVKNYSSGMLVRLAFSIAVQTEADIYILDEILAVGDALFQQKSIEIINNLTEQGKTILFVSHDLKSIERYCQKALWIDKGELRFFGKTDVAINKYQNEILYTEEKEITQKLSAQEKAIEDKEQTEEILKLGSLEVEVQKVNVNVRDGDVFFDFYLKHNKVTSLLNLVVGIYKDTGEYVTAFGTNMDEYKLDPKVRKVSVRLERPNLLSGHYYANIAVFGDDESKPYYWQKRVGVFGIQADDKYRKYRGSVYFAHDWSMQS